MKHPSVFDRPLRHEEGKPASNTTHGLAEYGGGNLGRGLRKYGDDRERLGIIEGFCITLAVGIFYRKAQPAISYVNHRYAVHRSEGKSMTTSIKTAVSDALHQKEIEEKENRPSE